MENWQNKALNLYSDGKKINEIAEELELARKTVSKYINALPCSTLSQAKNKRKEISSERRKKQKKEYRDKMEVQNARLRTQHEIDVMVLSYEKYF